MKTIYWRKCKSQCKTSERKNDINKLFAIKIKIISICLILEEVLEKVYTGDEVIEQFMKLLDESGDWK